MWIAGYPSELMLNSFRSGQPVAASAHVSARTARSGLHLWTQGRTGFVPPVSDTSASSAQSRCEAAKALGLSGWLRFRLVVFPQAIKTILPPLGNDFIAMVKDSSLVSVLGVADITQMGKVYASGSFRFFETYSIVAYVYLVMTVGLSLALRGLEKRLRRSEAR